MSVRINQSGTWRSVTSLCVNQSGTWRRTSQGLINESGTWRQWCGIPDLGSSYGGGNIIYKSGSGSAWIASPFNSEVSRNWYSRNDAANRATEVTGISGWFVPDCGGFTFATARRAYWTGSNGAWYWTNQEVFGTGAWRITYEGGGGGNCTKSQVLRVRSFRTITY